MNADKNLLALLACPACRGPLEFWLDTAKAKAHPDGQSAYKTVRALRCAACNVFYPVREGIPVLLKEEGVPGEAWLAAHR